MNSYELELLRELERQGGEGVLGPVPTAQRPVQHSLWRSDNLQRRGEIEVGSTQLNRQESADYYYAYYAAHCALTASGQRALAAAA